MRKLWYREARRFPQGHKIKIQESSLGAYSVSPGAEINSPPLIFFQHLSFFYFDTIFSDAISLGI